MTKKLSYSIFFIILTLGLVACQVVQAATLTSASAASNGTIPNQAAGTMPANPNRAQAGAATPTAVPTLKPTATATATAVPVNALAEATARTYFNALQTKDFTAAAKQLSIFSLSYAGLTRATVASQLNALSIAGTTWSDLQIVGSQVFNDSTILVHVTYKAATVATAAAGTGATATPTADTSLKDELWPFRLEGDSWAYNWNNLIDMKTVESTPQTTSHITIKPMLFARYSDHLELHFMLQNQNSDVVYFVQPYDSLAQFHFGSQVVEAEKTRKIVVSGLRTAYDEVIEVKGLYTSFPNWVEIRKWQGYAPNPLFSFEF